MPDDNKAAPILEALRKVFRKIETAPVPEPFQRHIDDLTREPDPEDD